MAQGGSGSVVGGAVTPVGDILNKSGSTTGSNVVVINPIQPGGLIGIGSIENVGSFKMTVTETVIDKLGNTVSVETVVEPGDWYLLDPQTSFDDGAGGLALPPFTNYTVEVRFKADGTATDYILRYVDVAPGAGRGVSGGPPGTWEKIASGQTAVVPGATETLLANLPMPNSSTFIYVPFVTFDQPGGGPLALFPGNTLVAPPANTITYGFESASNIDFKARSNAGAPPCVLNWVLYKVTP